MELRIDLGGFVARIRMLGLLEAEQRISPQFHLPTIGLRPKSYPLTATLRSPQCVLGKVVETVQIAQRPNPNWMPVWLWPHQAFLDQPTALLNILEGAGGRYLVVVNDKRTYDDRVGEYRAVLGKIVPQTVTITLLAHNRRRSDHW